MYTTIEQILELVFFLCLAYCLFAFEYTAILHLQYYEYKIYGGVKLLRIVFVVEDDMNILQYTNLLFTNN